MDNNTYKNSKYKIIDISKKKESYRRACVCGSIYLGKEVFNLVKDKKIEKGDPLILAEIAGINAAKNISNLILLSHQINIENVFINIVMDEQSFKIKVYCIVFANSKTGVEMEAMCGVSTSLLTIYDLTKKLNPFIFIENIKLLFKDGGENGLVLGSINNIPVHLKKYFINVGLVFDCSFILIITMSDRAFNGSYKDLSGQLLIDFFLIKKIYNTKKIIIPDDEDLLIKLIKTASIINFPNIILITGGTGSSKKDVTNRALSKICDKKITGIDELIRLNGNKYSNFSWLSSSFSGIYKKSIILSFPGNPSAVLESLVAIEHLIPHMINSLA